MNHFDALTYSRYVDDDLAAAETAAVRQHLAVCPECAAQLRALENENRVLRSVLVEEAVPAALRARLLTALFGQGPSLGPAMLYAGGILAGIFAGVYYLASLLESESLIQPLSWLDPMSSGSWVDWLFRTFFYFYEEGWTMWLNSVERLAALAAALVALRAVLPWLRRRWPSLLGVTLMAVLLLWLSAPVASAVEFRHAHGAVVKVAKGEVVAGTLVAAGQTVVVDGTVEGDLVAAGNRIEVRGEVKGNVIAAGHTLIIGGNVANDAILAGQRITVEGQVGRNVFAACEHFDTADAANVAQSLFAAASMGMIDGKIGDSLVAAMGSLQVAGAVAKNIRFRGGRFSLLSGAQVGGDLLARTRRPAQIDPGAQISGRKTLEIIRRTPRYMSGSFYFFQFVWLLAAFVLGVLLLKAFPGFYREASEAVGSVWRSLGLGLAVLAGVPVAAVAVGVTLVGLPLALITVAIYVIALYLAKIFVAAYLGRRLLQIPPAAGYTSLGALFLGLFILVVLGNLPYIGWLIKLVIILGGLGALSWQLYQRMKPSSAA